MSVTTYYVVHHMMLIVVIVQIPLVREKQNNNVSFYCYARKIKVATVYTIATFLVEMRRIELLSENLAPRLSPSAVDVLTFPHSTAHQQAVLFGSLLCVTA